MLPHITSLRYMMIMTCACSASAVLSLHHPLAAVGLRAWAEHQLSLQQPPLAAWPNLPELLECLNHARHNLIKAFDQCCAFKCLQQLHTMHMQSFHIWQNCATHPLRPPHCIYSVTHRHTQCLGYYLCAQTYLPAIAQWLSWYDQCSRTRPEMGMY